MRIRKVKTSALMIGILVELIFAVFLGVTAGARGLGSLSVFYSKEGEQIDGNQPIRTASPKSRQLGDILAA